MLSVFIDKRFPNRTLNISTIINNNGKFECHGFKFCGDINREGVESVIYNSLSSIYGNIMVYDVVVNPFNFGPIVLFDNMVYFYIIHVHYKK